MKTKKEAPKSIHVQPFVWHSVAKYGPPGVKIGEVWRGMAANANQKSVFHAAEYRLSHWNDTDGKVYAWSCEWDSDVPENYFTHWAEYPVPPPKEEV